MSTRNSPVVNIDSIRADLEHIDAALRCMETARAWLRQIDCTYKARFVLLRAIESTHAVRRVAEARLNIAESDAYAACYDATGLRIDEEVAP